MIPRPHRVWGVAIATLLLVSFAIVRPVPAAPAAPPSRTDVGPDGHWERLFVDVPVGVKGQVVHDALNNRGLLASSSGIWELPFIEPLAWKKISTPTGGSWLDWDGRLVVFDPLANRLLAVRSAQAPGDSMRVFQLPLSNPTAWLELSSVGAPVWESALWSPGAAVFDPASSAIEIFGGTRWNGDYLLAVNLSTFATVDGSSVSFSPTVPAVSLGERSAFATAVDAARSRLMVYGGANGHFEFYDVDTAPLGSMTFEYLATTGTPPGAGYAVVDPVRDRMLINSGYISGSLTHQLSLEPPHIWIEIATVGSHPSSKMPMVYDALNDRMLAFRASESPWTLGHHVWTLSLDEPMTWTDRTPHPDGKSGSVIIEDSNSGRLVYHASGNHLWTMTTAPFRWSRLTVGGAQPQSRQDHEGVYDSARDRMIIFGGRSNTATPPMNDVWALSLDDSPAWSALAPAGTPPAARYWPSAIYDPVGDRMLVWGGADGATQYTDLWQLTLSGTPQWSALPPAGPAPGYIENANAIYDPVRERMLIVGGTPGGETWVLTLTGSPEWSALPTCPGTNVNAFYDQTLDRLVAINNSGDLYALSLADPDAWQPLAPTGSKPESASAPIVVAEAAGNHAFVWPTDGSAISYVLEFVDNVAAPGEAPARRVTLSAVTPNPALTTAMVRLALPAEAEVTLDVFDATGRRVRRLAWGRMSAGEHAVSWDLRDAAGRSVEPGVFLYALTVGGERLTRRMAVLR